jgi:hypothetical protein
MLPIFFEHFAAANCAVRYFFGIPSWDRYLVEAGRIQANAASGSCEIVNGIAWQNGGDIVLIALGLLDIVLRLAGLVAVGYIIYGGIQYITSDGAPDATKDAQQTIINALVGLVIALLATATVSFIGTAVAK